MDITVIATIALIIAEGISLLILLYFFSAFVISRWTIPNLGYRKSKLPEKIPIELAEVVDRMKRQAKNDYDFLWQAYNYVTGKYDGKWNNLSEFISRRFWSLERIWPVHDHVPDTQQNFILRIMLLKSGFFRDEDIEPKHVALNFFIHQYLIIKTTKGLIEVDPASDYKGATFNKHAEGFM